ncbi:MAG: response regulator [Saprospiraceae bacterium]|nr:response regulator [Saprospiraceae bacterium]
MDTILLLEDDKNLRETLVDIFELKGFRTLTAVNGREGLKMVDEYAPDVIISDVMMPEMDGLEFLKILKENPQTQITPIIMITANTVKDVKFKGLEFGANDYITKPFDSRELLLKVQNLIKINPQKVSQSMVNNIKVASKDEIFLTELKEQMRLHLSDENLTVEQLAQALFLGKSTFQRRVKKVTKMTATDFIRTFRLEYAYQLIENDAGNMSNIAQQTGFRSLAYFSYAFKQHFGINPTEIKKK